MNRQQQSSLSKGFPEKNHQMAPWTILLCGALFSIAVAQQPQVRQLSDAQFQQTLSQQLPSNSLITGANRARGTDAMMRAKRFVLEQGCNTHVCFALDAGVFVTQEEYTLQQDFATLVAAVAGLDERFFVAGAQYGLERNILTNLTSNVDRFLVDVDGSTAPGEWSRARRRESREWRRRSRRVFARTLRYCRRQVNRRRGLRARKIVFLGDVRSPRGGVRVAERFIPPMGNGAICAVGFGEGNRARLERFTGDPDRILGPQQSGEALDILEEVVRNVCGPNNPSDANSLFTETAV